MNWEITFEKWDKIGFDQDKNITITRFLAIEFWNLTLLSMEILGAAQGWGVQPAPP